MWLLPSRSRPENLKRFFAACKATGTSTPGMALVDHVDYAMHEAAYDALKAEMPLGWQIRVTKLPTQGAKIREIWDQVKDSAWLGLIGDDNIPETPHWDRLLVERLTGWNLISCNDQWLAPRRVANCWVMSGPLVRAVGYIFPPGMEHLFVDDVWERIGREGGCWTCRMDVVVRHAHVMKGAAPADATHKAVYGKGFTVTQMGPDKENGLWASDEAVYREWLGAERERILALIPKVRPAPDPAHEARMERAKSRKVMIVTPVHEKPAWQYLVSITDTVEVLTRLGIQHQRRFLMGNSNLPRARNELAAMFLASDCTDALLIDADMGWGPGDVIRALASDKPLLGVVGRKKVDKPVSDPSIWCTRLIPGTQNNLRQDEMGNIEVLGVGTGFLKIERCVFERMIEAHPEWKRAGRDTMSEAELRNYYKFFRFPDDEHDTGEDYEFCNAWRALGGQVWIDPTIGLIHAGMHGYTGCFGDILEPEAAPAGSAPGVPAEKEKAA